MQDVNYCGNTAVIAVTAAAKALSPPASSFPHDLEGRSHPWGQAALIEITIDN